MSPALQIFGILLSAAAALIGGLVLWNLRLISKRLDAHDDRINKLEAEQKHLAARKEKCQTAFVASEAWIRSERYTRDRLEAVISTLNRLEGKFLVIEKLPEICGNIAREITNQLKPGVN